MNDSPSFFTRLIRSKFGVKVIQRKLTRARERKRFLKALSTRKDKDYYFRDASELTLAMNYKPYINDLEVPLLSKYAASAHQTIVEIGCAYGGSSILFLAHAPGTASVYSIDPFIVDSMVPFEASRQKCIESVTAALTFVGLDQKLKQWQLISDYSYNIAAGWTKKVDMLFIDGDHHYDAVRKDYSDWIGHVRNGGLILFHDSRKLPGTAPETFDRGWSGPTRFVDELSQSSSVVLLDTAYSTSVFRKIA